MSRPQARSRLIGWMKKPRLDRGPKLNSAITHPQMMITSGVRQELAAGRRVSAVAAMRFLDALGADREGRSDAPRGVNAFAWKSQGQDCKNFRRRAALQNRRVQFGFVIPEHRAAMNPESRDWLARSKTWPCGPSRNDESNRSLPLRAGLFGR